MTATYRVVLLIVMAACLAGCVGNAASHRGGYVSFSGGVNGL
jgi:hypothetical protein